jgi:chromosome partitioning protein
MRTIAVVNQKGGCGKTTTSINLSAFLALNGRRTLVVDMDPQGHATLGLVREAAEPSKTLYDVFTHHRNGRETRVQDVIRSVQPNLDVAPSDILLSGIPEKLSRVRRRESILAEIIAEVRADYDYVIVDCPPHVGLLTFNALCACSEAIVPVDPSFFSLHGIGKLFETFDLLMRKTGHQISVRALATLYNGRTRFARDVVDEIRSHLAGRYFTTVIRYSMKLAEAASHGLPIAAYSRRCAGFDDYEALAAEVLEMEKVSASEAAAETAKAPEELQKFVLYGASGPRRTGEGVVFALEAPEAHRVQLVGDFNEWALDGAEMTQSGGVWTQLLRLQPGRYRYRYVVDGCWCSDPRNTDVEPSPYGGDNSVCVVAE